MHSRFPLVAIATVVLIAAAPTPADVPFTRYSYHVKADLKPDVVDTLLIATTQQEFDATFFIPAPIAGHTPATQPALAPDAFKTQIVVADIKQPKRYGYTVFESVSVTQKADIVTIKFTSHIGGGRGAGPENPGASALVLAVPKAGVQTIQFIENDKNIGEMKVPAPAK